MSVNGRSLRGTASMETFDNKRTYAIRNLQQSRIVAPNSDLAPPKTKAFPLAPRCVLFPIPGGYRPASSTTPEKLIPTPIKPTMKPTNVLPAPSWVRMSPRIPTETPDTATAVPRPTTSPRTLYGLGNKNLCELREPRHDRPCLVGIHPRAGAVCVPLGLGSRVSMSQGS